MVTVGPELEVLPSGEVRSIEVVSADPLLDVRPLADPLLDDDDPEFDAPPVVDVLVDATLDAATVR
jgi:hypothetical protein